MLGHNKLMAVQPLTAALLDLTLPRLAGRADLPDIPAQESDIIHASESVSSWGRK
jgi:hypothetical protein